MSHFRDRVITSPNIPQLPSGIRTTTSANVPAITAAVVAVSAPAPALYSINLSAALDSLVPTQTDSTTSP